MPLLTPSAQPWVPHAYQKKGVKFLIERTAAALLLDPGLGKTGITLGGIKILKKRGFIKKALIIAPLRVCYEVWPAEIAKWSDFKELRIENLHGSKKDEALARDADLYIINPAGLDWLLKPERRRLPSGKYRQVVDVKAFKALGFDTLIIDELTQFKNISSGRSKLLKQVLHTFGRRWGLTGSPTANGLLDLFGQCYALDSGRALGPYVTHYRSQFFTEVAPFTWRPRPGAPDKIYARIASLALRMAAEDYLELPELIPLRTIVELPPKARTIYEKIEDDMIARINDDSSLVAVNAASVSSKCRQIANGAVYIDPELTDLIRPPKSAREWLDVHDEKLSALGELIEELQGDPLLVAYDFNHDLERLRKRFPNAPYIGGGVSPIRVKEILRAWNADEIPVLFGHPASMGHGINAQQGSCKHVAWFSLTWDFELYDQFIRRVYRQGVKAKRVFVHHFVARDTVDETMLYALNAKDKGQKTFFAALQALSKNRTRT